ARHSFPERRCRQEKIGVELQRCRAHDSRETRGGSGQLRPEQDDERKRVESIKSPREIAVVTREPEGLMQQQTLAAPDERASDILIEQPWLAGFDAAGGQTIHEHEVP